MVKIAKELRMISIESIEANREQPRKTFVDDSLTELAESIKSVGIIQPLTVCEIGDGRFRLISGERRLRASSLAGLQSVPCVLMKAEAEEMEVMSLVENIQREDLNFIEEAIAYKQLIDNHGMTQVQLAERVGKKQSTISNKLRILKLSSVLLEKIKESNLSERHARALLQIPDEELRMKALKAIISRNLNVKQTEDLVAKLKSDIMLNTSKRMKNVFSYKIYTNTIKQACEKITKTGLNVNYNEECFSDRVEVKIVIPIEEL